MTELPRIGQWAIRRGGGSTPQQVCGVWAVPGMSVRVSLANLNGGVGASGWLPAEHYKFVDDQ